MDIKEILKHLNRIEHLLDTIHYSPSVPVAVWYEKREKLEKMLHDAGFKFSSDGCANEVWDNGNEVFYALYTTEMADGFPEEWDDI